MLNVFWILHIGPIRFSWDRKSAIYIAANPILHERTKHIKRDCYQVPDEVHAKLITTQHISTKEQPADILIKALPTPTFTCLHSKLGIQDNSRQEGGGDNRYNYI